MTSAGDEGHGGGTAGADCRVGRRARDGQRQVERRLESDGDRATDWVDPDADVQVLGPLPDDLMPPLMRAADIFAFPSEREGFGLVVLEAQAAALPAVVSDLPVLRENADGGGCLTARINDATDWAEKLRTVLTDTEENRRLQAAAMARSLPRWAETAAALRRGLNSA